MSNEPETVKSDAQLDSKQQQQQQQQKQQQQQQGQQENVPIDPVHQNKPNEVFNWQNPEDPAPKSEAHVLLKVKSGLDTNISDSTDQQVDENVKKSMESDNDAEGAELKRVEEDISLKVLKDDTKVNIENEEVAKGVSNPLVHKN